MKTKIMSYSRFGFLLLPITPLSVEGQVWRLEGVNDLNRDNVEDVVQMIDGVAEVHVDSNLKTLNINPRPAAVISSDQILTALKLVPDVKLGRKISETPQAPKAIPNPDLKFPPDLIDERVPR